MKLFMIFSLFFISSPLLYSKNPPIISSGDIDKKVLYLTFDDGYPLKNSYSILDTLNKTNVKACFFLYGDFINSCPGFCQKAIESGNIIGCHTWTHRDITLMSESELAIECKKWEKQYEAISGDSSFHLFRPPMGKINQAKKKILDDLGYKIFLWNITYPDYAPSLEKGKAYAKQIIMSQIKDGGIILMHTMSTSNTLALEDIINECLNQGYSFKLLTTIK